MPSPRAAATVELGLGGSFFGQVATDAPTRYDWRFGLSFEASSFYRYNIIKANIATYGTFSYSSMTPTRAGVTITDFAQVVAGQIPDGGQGLQFRSASSELAYAITLSLSSMNTFEIVCQIDTLPAAGETVIVGEAIGGTGPYTAWSVWVTSAGALKGYIYGPILGSSRTLAGGTISAGSLLHIVMTRSGGAGSNTFKMYVNGSLADTLTTADHVAGQTAMICVAADDDTTATKYLDLTMYFLGYYSSVELSSTQVSNHYNALLWTDKTTDVKQDVPLVVERGFRDSSLFPRVPQPGFCTFALDNGSRNSVSTSGYYSPGHASANTHFHIGTPVRVKVGSTTIFRGRISSVAPEPNARGSRRTMVTASDWLLAASRTRMTGTQVMTDVRSDQIASVLAQMAPVGPTDVILGTGTDTYALAFNNSSDESVSVLAELDRLATSEVGWAFVRRDGSFEFQGRTERILSYDVSSLTISNTMVDLVVREINTSRVNVVILTGHPLKVDAGFTSVLVNLDEEFSLGPSQSLILYFPYRNQDVATVESGRVGADMSSAVVAAAMWSGSGGTGTDLSAYLTTDVQYGPNSCKVTFTNTSALSVGVVTSFTITGKGIYDRAPVVSIQSDDAAVADNGVNSLIVDLPYQEDPNVVDDLARTVLAAFVASAAVANSVSILLSDLTWTVATVLSLDISDRITIVETQTGVNGDYYIQGVRIEITNAGFQAMVTFTVIPADPVGAYWELGTAGKSELDSTTVLF